jgi:hypothetical protein
MYAGQGARDGLKALGPVAGTLLGVGHGDDLDFLQEFAIDDGEGILVQDEAYSLGRFSIRSRAGTSSTKNPSAAGML